MGSRAKASVLHRRAGPPVSADAIAPDIAIVGAARAGTSFLSATLANHPRIDGGAVKEPNYYSSRWDEGRDWYDGLFEARRPGYLRLDASVSYTYPQHVSALERLCDANPDVQVVYVVREPVARMVSHFQLMRYYAGHDKWATLGDAMAMSPMFVISGAYDEWLPRLRSTFPIENILVVPFPAVTKDTSATASLIVRRSGLALPAASLGAPTFRNEVRSFRLPIMASAHRRLIKSRYYPALRSRVGPDRLRDLRQRLTRSTDLPSTGEELQSLSVEQRAVLADARSMAVAAVDEWLSEQDDRLGLDWQRRWRDHTRD